MDKNLVSINDLAKRLNINKSKVNYYVELGLLEPVMVVSNMKIFELDVALTTFKIIKKGISKGFKLKEIKKIKNAGIDYSKDNVFDAIGRPDLKPKK